MLKVSPVVFAVEDERVEAAAAVDLVIAVARIPDERVVAGAEERRVGAFTANDRVVALAADEGVVAVAAVEGVVAVAAEELICAGAAGQRVVAVAAEQLCGGQHCVVERDRVVAVPAEHHDFGGVGERRLAAVDGYGAVVHENLPSRVAAGRDGVAVVVSGLHEHAGGGRLKLAMIAMVVVLSKVWPRRRCALAVNRVWLVCRAGN